MIKGGRVVRSPAIRPIRKSGSTPKLRFRLDYWLDLPSLRQASLRQIPRSAIHSRFPGPAHLASRPCCDIRHGVVVWWIRQMGRLHLRCSSSELPEPAESCVVGCTVGESISRRAFQVAVGGRHRRGPNRSTYLTSPMRFVVAAGVYGVGVFASAGDGCCNIPISPTIPRANFLPRRDDWCKRLVYKGECQEKYFSLDRKWRNFS